MHLAFRSREWFGLIFLLAAATSCKSKEKTAWKLPVDAKQLPATTNVVEAEIIEGMREADPHVKQAYTSSELASEICREGMADPAHQLELMTLHGLAAAKQFFKVANLEHLQQALECGGVLASALEGQFQTAVGFVDDAGAKAEIDIIQMKNLEMPSKYGLTKRAFGAAEGLCRTSEPDKPSVTIECGPKSEAAFHHGSTWFFGQRGELDQVARTIANPKEELSTHVAALNDAANESEGLSSMRIEAQLTTAKPFLSAPCTWGAFQSGGNLNEFVQGCFPASDNKVIQDIDAKLRAAAFEIEPDVLKAGAVHGNVVLVARDDDAAKTVEKDATELAADWKAQLENNEAKLVKQAKEKPTSLRQKSWAVVVDNFIRGVQKMKVTRSGRTVKMSFNEVLSDDDKRDLEEAKRVTLDRRVAVADVLGAIQGKKPIPAASLTKLIGAPWATYFAAEATFDPKALPPECAARKKPAAKGRKAAPVAADPRCVAPVEPHDKDFGDKTAPQL